MVHLWLLVNSREIKCLDHDHSLLMAEQILESIYSDSPLCASSSGAIEIETIIETLKRGKNLIELILRKTVNVHCKK